MAFVYDPLDVLTERLNPASVICQRLESGHWEAVLRDLVEEHRRVGRGALRAADANH